MLQDNKNQFNYFMALARFMKILDDLEEKNPQDKEALGKVYKSICKLGIEFLQEEEKEEEK